MRRWLWIPLLAACRSAPTSPPTPARTPPAITSTKTEPTGTWLLIEAYGLRMRCDRTPAEVLVDAALTEITCGTDAIQLLQTPALDLKGAIVRVKENLPLVRATLVREERTARGYRIEFVTPRGGGKDYWFEEIVAVGKEFYACEGASRATDVADGDTVSAARATEPCSTLEAIHVAQ